jgi:hypothetical protein
MGGYFFAIKNPIDNDRLSGKNKRGAKNYENLKNNAVQEHPSHLERTYILHHFANFYNMKRANIAEQCKLLRG